MADTVTANDDYESTVTDPKNTWSSLPTEIKQKVLKYVPLATRMSVKSICKQWFDIVVELNKLQTKLVFIDDDAHFELPHNANLVCDLPSHSFDSTVMIRLPRPYDGQRILKNFSNLVAVYLSDASSEMAALITRLCHNLEHLSISRYYLQDKNFEPGNLLCLQDLDNALRGNVQKFANLRHCYCELGPEVLGGMWKRGLVGFSLDRRQDCIDQMKQHGMNAKILYGVALVNNLIDTLSQMRNLKTIHGFGHTDSLASLNRMTGLTKLSWKVTAFPNSGANGSAIKDALLPWGHRLRSLKIGAELHQTLIIMAVVASCRNLVELHIFKISQDDDDTEVERYVNSVQEFSRLKRLTKLRTLSIEFRDVNVKFLQMLDTKLPGLQEIGDLGVFMTIEQLVRYQHEITERSSLAMALDTKLVEVEAKDKRIQELESQLSKLQ